jgi:hypothetical protein
MNLSKKTTILLPPDLHEQLTRQAEREGRSLGDLVLRACRVEYGSTSQEERRRALEELLAMDLPVGEPDEMKRESEPTPVETRASDRHTRRSS